VPFGDVTVAVTRRRSPVPVVVAVGANLPHGEQRPHDTVRAAIDTLAQHADVTVVSVSGLHDTEPVGGPEQPTYVNAVVTARTSLSPTSLLRALHDLEASFDRRREVRWGARTLDLDLVQYGDPASDTDVTSDLARLTLPHPRAHERAFVLVPWLEADPAAVLRHEGRAVPVTDLVAGLDTTGVRPRPTEPSPTTDEGHEN
jgi:dihydroneopterin aldolase / 2-amino-4-hydroxy-6-hydroxymethyldihydropteridine diphosphokinase